MRVRNTCNAVFSPPESPGSSMLVREIYSNSETALRIICMATHGSRHRHQHCNPRALYGCISSDPGRALDGEYTCGPLPLCNIGTPFLPVLGALTILLQTLLLFGEVVEILNANHLDSAEYSAETEVTLSMEKELEGRIRDNNVDWREKWREISLSTQVGNEVGSAAVLYL
jgi:hypothetical protein